MSNKIAISVEEARQELGLSRTLMYQAVKEGIIEHVRVGRRILIPVRSLEKFLNGGSSQVEDPKDE